MVFPLKYVDTLKLQDCFLCYSPPQNPKVQMYSYFTWKDFIDHIPENVLKFVNDLCIHACLEFLKLESHEYI